MKLEGCGSYLHDSAERATSIFENSLQVLAHGSRLFGDAAFDQVARSIRGQLARDEDVWTRDDGLRLDECQ